MKKILSFITISMIFLITGFANAETRVAIIDVYSILQEMPQRENISKSLSREFDARAKALQADEKKANEAAQKLKKEGMTLSASEKSKLTNVINSFENKAKEFSIDYHKRENEEANKLLMIIQDAAKVIADRENFNLVLKSEAAFYVKDGIDITNKVLAQVKK